MSMTTSPSDGLPWPVVLLLALATLAALYGVSVLSARSHARRIPAPAAETPKAHLVPLSDYDGWTDGEDEK
jgi:hypothetical protein